MDDADDRTGRTEALDARRSNQNHRHGEPGAVRVATSNKRKLMLVVPTEFREHHDTRIESLRSGNIQLRCFLGKRTGPGRSDASTDDWG